MRARTAARIIAFLGKDKDVLALMELPVVRVFKIKVSFPMAEKKSIFRRPQREPAPACRPARGGLTWKQKNSMKPAEKKIASAVSLDLPLIERPFRAIASGLAVTEGDLLAHLRAFRKKHFLRKYAAVLNHRKAGFDRNAMVAWRVPGELMGKAGALMASYEAVSHCYQRRTVPGWAYNLYSMIHGRSAAECLALVRKISGQAGLNEYRVLFSSKEYKKTGVKI